VFEADDPLLRPSQDAPDAEFKTQPDVETPEPESGDEAFGRRATGRAAPETDRRPPAQTLTPPGPARVGIGNLFVGAVLALTSLAIGLWFARFVSIAVARDDWIGWTAKGLAVIIAAILVVLFLRELVGLLRLARLGRLRRDAEEAIAQRDIVEERRVVKQIKGLVSGRPSLRWALAAFREEERHQTEPGQLLALADRVLLADADKQARRVIYESARRVAVVTAVVPIAFLSMLFVLFENVRMVRRLAGTYGGRPGLIGGWRLLIRVVFHIAATGAIALTDDLFGQFLGQDVIRRLSARLGEGAFNGSLTARLGVVAIELCRPCPYIAAKPLRARHVISELFPEFKAGDLLRRDGGSKQAAGASE